MKVNLLAMNLIILVSFCLTLISCNGKDDPETFLIKVDSIHVTDALVANTPFEIDFFGTIGENGCYSFLKFRNSVTDKEITIEALGSMEKNAYACPEVMVYLTGHSLTLTVPIPGTYIIKVKQPDSGTLSRVIDIK